jgi:ATP-dependent Clp protease ATP-binding subunit ClpC
MLAITAVDFSLERATESLRRVIARSETLARGLCSDYVGTEHLLLSLVNNGDNAAKKVLECDKITPDMIDREFQCRRLHRNCRVHNEPIKSDNIWLSEHAERALNEAARQAREHLPDQIGTHHLLLALIRDEVKEGTEGPVAGAILNILNVHREDLLGIIRNAQFSDPN